MHGFTARIIGGIAAVLPLLGSLAAQPLPYVGVNLASAEFGYPENVPGEYIIDYIYPTQNEVAYFQSKGMNTFRLPFLWERLQPTLGGSFDEAELSRLTTFVNDATASGAHVILDVHDYAQYIQTGVAYPIGTPEVTVEDFASFWGQLAGEFKTNSQVMFGLMNEPPGTPTITTESWFTAAQASVNAIRAAGAPNPILAPGNYYTGGWSWVSGNGNGTPNAKVMGALVDPGVEGHITSLIYEVHQYLDWDYSGSTPDISHNGATVLEEFTAWLRETGNIGFLAEFGVGEGEIQDAAVSAMLSYMEDNSDVWAGWTWWAGGPYWSDDYFLNLNPINGVDAPQMAYLQPYLPAIPEPSTGWMLAGALSLGLLHRSLRRTSSSKA